MSTLSRPRFGLSHFYLRILPGKKGKKKNPVEIRVKWKEKNFQKGVHSGKKGDLLCFISSGAIEPESSLASLPPPPFLEISLINSAPILGSNTDKSLNVTRPGVVGAACQQLRLGVRVGGGVGWLVGWGPGRLPPPSCLLLNPGVCSGAPLGPPHLVTASGVSPPLCLGPPVLEFN